MLRFAASGPQQLNFSAGAQQVARSPGEQQAGCDVVPFPSAGATTVPVVSSTVALDAADGRNGRDESADMDESPFVWEGRL